MKKDTKEKIKFVNKIIKPVFSDKRGHIYDILEGEKVGHVGMITFSKGVVRASHYHLKSTQYSYVISGKIELTIATHEGKNKKTYILNEGSFNVIPPKTYHRYKALTKAVILDLTTMSRNDNGYEKDTVRIEI